MKAGFMKAMLLVAIMAVTGVAKAADFTIRATANSNENDEDYDGLVVFKNYVESASNGAIAVELFIGTQLCSKGAECLQGVADLSGRTLNTPIVPFISNPCVLQRVLLLLRVSAGGA